MNTAEKCEEILREIVRLCDEAAGKDPTSPVISFGPDWGGNALTLYIGEDHTHVGSSDDSFTFDQLVNSLHARFLEGKGLSFQIPIGDAKA